MAKFRPVKVDKMEELEQAVKDKYSVILLTNNNISKKVKEKCDHDVKQQKKSDNLIKVGGVAAVVGVGAFVAGLFTGGVVPVAIYAFSSVGAMFTLGAGGGKKVLNLLTTELKDYKWYEIKEKRKTCLILYRYRGTNKFNPDKDELE